jgi:hypothetical protein
MSSAVGQNISVTWLITLGAGGKIHHRSSFYSSSLAYGPYSLTSASFRMIAHADLSSALFLHLLTPIVSRSFTRQSSHLNFGLLAFSSSIWFPQKYLLYGLIVNLTRWPAHSNLITVIMFD